MSPLPRPTRPALSRDYLVDQALELLDRTGVPGFSMRRLGRQIGVDAMAIYHYFGSQAELFDAVVSRLYREAAEGVPLAAGPQANRLRTLYEGLRRQLLAHPGALPLAATRPAAAEVQPLAERVLGVLAEAGVSPGRRLDILTCLTVFTVGHCLAMAAPPAGGPGPDPGKGRTGATYPLLSEALGFLGPGTPDRQFTLGLQALVSGLLAQVAE